MRRTSAELKRLAREHLTGQYGLAMGAAIMVLLISTVIRMPFTFMYMVNQSAPMVLIYNLASMIISLLTTVLTSGLLHIHLKFARRETAVFSDLFFAVTRRPDRFLVAGLIQFLITVACILPSYALLWVCRGLYYSGMDNSKLWLMLALCIVLLIAGIVLLVVLGLYFSLIYLLLVDHDSMNAIDAMKESWQLMRGNMGRLFYIRLSFIGWMLLGILSCYIGLLWIIPYVYQTSVEFYRDVTGELTNQASNFS